MSFSPKGYLEFPPSGFTLHWYAEFFEDRRWQAATVLSFKIAFATVAATLLVGTPVAYAIVRGRLLMKPAFSVLLMGPIIVPHIAIAVALYLWLAPLGLVGSLFGFVLAHTMLALPFFVFTVASALSQIDQELEAAAMSCGASRLRAFFEVTLPLITPSVLSGSLFAFVISFDEPTISFFLSSIRDRTLPRRMFENIEHSLTPELPAIATMLTVLSVALLLGAFLLTRWEKRRRQAAPSS
ncbi:MAG: ABC transporter permease [Pseudomonadota bacterium]